MGKGSRFLSRKILKFLGRKEVLLVFLIFLSRAAFEEFSSWNEHSRLAPAFAFVEPGTPYTGTFRIDELYKQKGRLETGDWSVHDGAYYSNKAPGTSMLAVPPYFILFHVERWLGFDPIKDNAVIDFNKSMLKLVVLALLTSWTVLFLIKKLPGTELTAKSYPYTVAVIYAFGLIIFPYETTYWGHTATANFVLISLLYLLSREKKSSFWAGVFAGAAVLTEYTALVSLIVCFFYYSARKNYKALKQFVYGALPGVLALLIYQMLCFGGFLSTAPENTNPMWLTGGQVLGHFSFPRVMPFFYNLFSLHRGVFIHMPILLFTIPGTVQLFKASKKSLAFFLWAGFLAVNLLVSAYNAWDAGATTSARYLIVALPYLVLLMPNPSKLRVPAFIFYGVLSLSIFNMLAIAATSSRHKSHNPLYGDAYKAFFSGEISFSPWARMISKKFAGSFSK